MECSPVTHDRNKGQLWTTQSDQLCSLTCLTQNKEVELGRGGAVNTNREIEAQRDR